MTRNRVSIVGAAARIAWRTLPELGNLQLAVVRLLLVPGFTALFYIAIANKSFEPASFGTSLATACVAAGVSGSVSAATLISFDRFEATTEFWAIAPRSTASLAWIGRNAAVIGVGLVSGVAGLLGLVVLGVARLPGASDVFTSLVILAVSALSAVGLGFFVGSVSSLMRDSLLLANLVEFGLPIVAGATAAVSQYPTGAAWIAAVFPTAWATEAARAVEDPMKAANRLGVSLAVGAAWFAVALILRRVLRTRLNNGASKTIL